MIEFTIGEKRFSCPVNRYFPSGGERALESRTLGEIQTLIRWLQLEENPHLSKFGLRLTDQSEWYHLVNLRNLAAHGGRNFGADEFSSAYNSFERIFRGSFDALVALKDLCRR